MSKKDVIMVDSFVMDVFERSSCGSVDWSISPHHPLSPLPLFPSFSTSRPSLPQRSQSFIDTPRSPRPPPILPPPTYLPSHIRPTPALAVICPFTELFFHEDDATEQIVQPPEELDDILLLLDTLSASVESDLISWATTNTQRRQCKCQQWQQQQQQQQLRQYDQQQEQEQEHHQQYLFALMKKQQQEPQQQLLQLPRIPQQDNHAQRLRCPALSSWRQNNIVGSVTSLTGSVFSATSLMTDANDADVEDEDEDVRIIAGYTCDEGTKGMERGGRRKGGVGEGEKREEGYGGECNIYECLDELHEINLRWNNEDFKKEEEQEGGVGRKKCDGWGQWEQREETGRCGGRGQCGETAQCGGKAQCGGTGQWDDINNIVMTSSHPITPSSVNNSQSAFSSMPTAVPQPIPTSLAMTPPPKNATSSDIATSPKINATTSLQPIMTSRALTSELPVVPRQRRSSSSISSILRRTFGAIGFRLTRSHSDNQPTRPSHRRASVLEGRGEGAAEGRGVGVAAFETENGAFTSRGKKYPLRKFSSPARFDGGEEKVGRRNLGAHPMMEFSRWPQGLVNASRVSPSEAPDCSHPVHTDQANHGDLQGSATRAFRTAELLHNHSPRQNNDSQNNDSASLFKPAQNCKDNPDSVRRPPMLAESPDIVATTMRFPIVVRNESRKASVSSPAAKVKVISGGRGRRARRRGVSEGCRSVFDVVRGCDVVVEGEMNESLLDRQQLNLKQQQHRERQQQYEQLLEQLTQQRQQRQDNKQQLPAAVAVSSLTSENVKRFSLYDNVPVPFDNNCCTQSVSQQCSGDVPERCCTPASSICTEYSPPWSSSTRLNAANILMHNNNMTPEQQIQQIYNNCTSTQRQQHYNSTGIRQQSTAIANTTTCCKETRVRQQRPQHYKSKEQQRQNNAITPQHVGSSNNLLPHSTANNQLNFCHYHCSFYSSNESIDESLPQMTSDVSGSQDPFEITNYGFRPIHIPSPCQRLEHKFRDVIALNQDVEIAVESGLRSSLKSSASVVSHVPGPPLLLDLEPQNSFQTSLVNGSGMTGGSGAAFPDQLGKANRDAFPAYVDAFKITDNKIGCSHISTAFPVQLEYSPHPIIFPSSDFPGLSPALQVGTAFSKARHDSYEAVASRERQASSGRHKRCSGLSSDDGEFFGTDQDLMTPEAQPSSLSSPGSRHPADVEKIFETKQFSFAGATGLLAKKRIASNAVGENPDHFVCDQKASHFFGDISSSKILLNDDIRTNSTTKDVACDIESTGNNDGKTNRPTTKQIVGDISIVPDDIDPTVNDLSKDILNDISDDICTHIAPLDNVLKMSPPISSSTCICSSYAMTSTNDVITCHDARRVSSALSVSNPVRRHVVQSDDGIVVCNDSSVRTTSLSESYGIKENLVKLSTLEQMICRELVRLAGRLDTRFGSLVHCFIVCTKEGKETNAFVVERNVDQFLQGLRNYLVNGFDEDFNQILIQAKLQQNLPRSVAGSREKITTAISRALQESIVQRLDSGRRHVNQPVTRD